MGMECLERESQEVIFQCLVAALKGPFFPDWEFETLFGVSRGKLADIVESWPEIDDTEQDVILAINNAMGNLVSYPHDNYGEWEKYISVNPEKVLDILQRWQK